MKINSTTICTLFVLFLSGHCLWSQPTGTFADSKWKDVSHINGCLFQIDTTAGGYFDPICDNRARWDFLIIYDDFTFSTTRTYFKDPNNETYSPSTILPLYSSELKDMKCNSGSIINPVLMFADPIYNLTYAIPDGKSMSFFYISNIYDGDEPPKRAILTDSNLTGSSMGLLIPESTVADVTKGKGIFANHNIVRDNELILVIDTDSLAENKKYILEFRNELSPINFPGLTTFIYPPISANTSVTDITREIEFNLQKPKTKNVFIALKADTNIINENDVEFKIRNTNLSTTEAILTSHDPNYMQLVDYCKPSKDESFCSKASYKINFQNSGDAATDKVVIKLKFKEDIADNIESAFFTGCDLNPLSRLNVSPSGTPQDMLSFGENNSLVCKSCKDDQENKYSNGQLHLVVNLKEPAEGDEHSLSDLKPEMAAVIFDINEPIKLSFDSKACAFDQSESGCIQEPCKCNSEDPNPPIIYYIIAVIILIIFGVLRLRKK